MEGHSSLMDTFKADYTKILKDKFYPVVDYIYGKDRKEALDASQFQEPQIDVSLMKDLENLAEESAGIFAPLKSSGAFSNKPLYDSSKATEFECALMLLILMLQYNLSFQCIEHIILFANMLLPVGVQFTASVFLLRGYFSTIFKSERKSFCNYCMKYLDTAKNCDDADCATKSPNISHFVYFDPTNQLKAIFSREKIRHAIFERDESQPKKIDENIESIRDGSLYKSCKGFLDEKHNISLSLYSDGVNLYRSQKRSIWPIFLTINTLPYYLRYKTENMLCIGIWYAESKPEFSTFLYPAVDFFKNFLDKGISIAWEGMSEKVTLRGLVLNWLGDSPARSNLIGMRQYNAKFGCNICIQMTEPSPCGAVGKRVYKFQKTMKIRTTKKTIKYSKICKPGKDQCGVLRKSILFSIIPQGRYVESMGLDLMHNLYSGVMKQLLTLWFTAPFKNLEKFSGFNKVTLLDRFLMEIKIPRFLSRAPRSIKFMAFFTSAELKDWFYYLSLPLLHMLEMPELVIQHHALLVQALYLLNQDSVSPQDIKKSECYLALYVSQFEGIYGLENCSSNVHYLLHLPMNVERHGPLRETSCMEYENMNGRIKKCVKGTHHPEDKIFEYMSLSQCLPFYIEQLSVSSEVREFYKRVTNPKKPKQLEKIDDSMFVIGVKYFPVEDYPESFERFNVAYEKTGKVYPKKVFIFKKLQKSRNFYSSMINTQAKKTISYCIQFEGDKCIGLVECYLKLKFCDCDENLCNCVSEYVALVNTCRKEQIGKLDESDFNCRAKISRNHVLIDVHEIETMCFWIALNGGDDCFCSKRVNNMQQE